MKLSHNKEIKEKVEAIGTKRTSIGSDKLNKIIDKVFTKYDKTIKRLS